MTNRSADATPLELLAGNGVEAWILAAITGSAVMLALLAARRFIRSRYQRLAATEQLELVEVPLRVARRTSALFMLVVATVAAVWTLELPDTYSAALTKAAVIAFWWQAGIWASVAVETWIEHRRSNALRDNRAAVTSLSIIGVVARALVWLVVLLLTLDNLGVNITALVAGLGVGGIAVALAVQRILGDLLASLSIALDQPFAVGDFLVVDDFLGSVEHIGIKSTRLRSLSGEQIVMANADLLESRVRNFGRMAERRVTFTIGVTYETPREALQRIPAMIRGIVEGEPGLRFDRSHFAAYGAFSIDFETVYYVLSANFNEHMDARERVFLAIHEAFEREGIEFAYPTQKLWLAPTPGPAPAGPTHGGGASASH